MGATGQRELQGLIDEVQSLVQTATNANGKCAELELKRQDLEARTNEVRKQLKSTHTAAEGTLKMVENLYQILLDLRKLIDRVQSMPVTGPRLVSAEGVFIWVLSLAALDTPGQPLQSDTFQTSTSGYNLSLGAAIYQEKPNGPRFLALSVVLLVGEFDAILPWPMPFGLALSLIDQSGKQNDICHEVPSKSCVEAFNRPGDKPNMPYVCLDFCSLDKLQKTNSGHVGNESIFVKAEIKFFSNERPSGVGMHYKP